MKILVLIFLCASLSFMATTAQGQTPVGGRATPSQNKIIVKLKEGFSVEALHNMLQPSEHKTPTKEAPANLRQPKAPILSIHPKHLDDVQSSFGLDRIYTIEIPEGKDISEVLKALENEAFIEYAETTPQMQLLYVPNDPLADPEENFQDNLKVIKAYEAWEIERGDSTMVIGILDTGVNINHEDLKDNIYRNPADPINGFDDDGDGYIDNYMGWDFAYNDNDPDDTNGHGTQVAGIAAARTNNGVGIAGIGFHTKFMPIKVFNDYNTFIGGYEAILYAAKKGCKVINLSWGNVGEYSKYAEDIIKTVVLDMDVVVVAAAGNSNMNEEYYPASYEYVLSVANTTKEDQKASGSTFSPYVGISAPGFDITTTSGSVYGSSFGTSMASPTVAGAAALVRARHPQLNALQVVERLRATADDIYHIGNNHQYKEHLGKGRLNILQALEDGPATSVRFREREYSNAVGPYAFSGDTITISGQFVNYLETAESLTVTLSTTSPYVSLIDSTFYVSSLSTLEGQAASFRVYLKPNLPLEEKLRFRLGYTGNNYEDYQYFDIASNPGHITIDNGQIAMTIGDNGNLGYYTDAHSNGIGLVYRDQSITIPLLKHAGVLIDNNGSVLDNMYNTYYPPIREKDFKVTQQLRVVEDNADYIKATSMFSDKASLFQTGLSITQSLSAFKKDGVNHCLFLDYKVTNKNPESIDTLRFGLYMDWDLIEPNHNRANYDFNYRLAYAFHPESQTYAGVALLSSQDLVYQSIALYDDEDNFIFGNTISEQEKLSLLLKDEERLATGPANIATTLTAVQYNLKEGETASVSYAIAAGKSLEEVQGKIAQAFLIKQPFIQLPDISFCPNEAVVIDPGLGSVYFYADSLLTDLLKYGSTLSLQEATEDFPVYIKKEKGWSADKYRLQVRRPNLNAYFELDANEIILAHGMAKISPHNKSTCASYWEWAINDSIVSNSRNPILQFDRRGNYTVKLTVSNENGETHAFSRSIEIDKVTGIAENLTPPTIEVYPNPVTGTLHISPLMGKQATISLTDQAGRILLQKHTTTSIEPFTIDVRSIQRGWYILQVRTNGKVYVRKVLIGG